MKITAEACPHHLIFTETDLLRLGAYGIMKPPLGLPRDREALWEGIRDGTIDIIATDHAPHSLEEKAGASPPFGVIGEPTLPVVWAAFHQRRLSIEDLVRMMYQRPAEIFDIHTDPDSYMEVDLDETFEFKREMVQSKAGYSPYVGRRVRGRIHRIVLHGTEVMRDGKIIARNGRVI